VRAWACAAVGICASVAAVASANSVAAIEKGMGNEPT
jgi:hypothetical protein